MVVIQIRRNSHSVSHLSDSSDGGTCTRHRYLYKLSLNQGGRSLIRLKSLFDSSSHSSTVYEGLTGPQRLKSSD